MQQESHVFLVLFSIDPCLMQAEARCHCLTFGHVEKLGRTSGCRVYADHMATGTIKNANLLLVHFFALFCCSTPSPTHTHTRPVLNEEKGGSPAEAGWQTLTLVKQSTTLGNTKQNIRKRFLRRPKRAGFFLCNFQKGRLINGVLGHVFRVHVLPF